MSAGTSSDSEHHVHITTAVGKQLFEAAEAKSLEGGRAIIEGIKARPELNGRTAQVLSYNAETRRYAVTLDSGEKLALRRDNLSQLAPGARVSVRGLSARPEFNGRSGTVIRWEATRDRFSVQLDEAAQPLLLRKENLDVLTPAAGSSMSDDEIVMQIMRCGLAGKQEEDRGHYPEALRLYEQAASCLQQLRDPQKAKGMAAPVDGSLGSLYTKTGQYSRAVLYLTKALAFTQSVGDLRNEEANLGSLALCHKELGQYEQALRFGTQALAVSRKIKQKPSERDHLTNIAYICEHLGQHETAIDHFNKALAISREIGDGPTSPACLHRLAAIEMRLGKTELAIEHFESALSVSRKAAGPQDLSGDAHAYSCLGNLYKDLGDYKKALDAYQHALVIDRKIGDVKSAGLVLGNIALLYDTLGEWDEARAHYEQALAISRDIGDKQSEARHLSNVGVMHGWCGSTDRMIQTLLACIEKYDEIWTELVSDERRISFGDTYAQVSHNLQNALWGEGRAAQALEQAERARARALEILLIQQRAANADISAGSMIHDKTQPASFSAISELAQRRGTAIVVYSCVKHDTVLAWVVGSADGRFSSQRLTVPDSLTQLIEITRATVTREGRRFADANRDLEATEENEDPAHDESSMSTGSSSGSRPCLPFGPHRTDELLRRCYQLLVAPFAASLVGEDHLLIIPSKELYALPFAALIDKHGGKRLIERHAISIAPSIGTLLQLEETRPDASHRRDEPRATVVGDPTFYDARLQLPGARLEAEEVSRLLSAQSVNSGARGSVAAVTHVSGSAASKPAVTKLMAQSEYVHLATHGLPTGVLLAGTPKAEALLTMAEVQGLTLRHARLIVLSACDSFRGELSSDGLVGIARAFVAAGARTLVASLWKVDDRATRALMSRFYESYFHGPVEANRCASVALQGAMLSMLREANNFHPWQWSAFVVFGLERE